MDYTDQSHDCLGSRVLDAIGTWLESNDRSDAEFECGLGEVMVAVQSHLAARGFSRDDADFLWTLAGDCVADAEPPN